MFYSTSAEWSANAYSGIEPIEEVSPAPSCIVEQNTKLL